MVFVSVCNHSAQPGRAGICVLGVIWLALARADRISSAFHRVNTHGRRQLVVSSPHQATSALVVPMRNNSCTVPRYGGRGDLIVDDSARTHGAVDSIITGQMDGR